MERIKTYIEGFDELSNGGIPAGSVNLIAGITGAMKSALAYYVLYKNAEHGKRGIYVALQQSERKLATQMENFGWSLGKVKGTLYLLDRYKIQEKAGKVFGKTFLDALIEHLVLIKQDFDYKLVVVDCLSALETVSQLRTPRFELFRFFNWLKKLCTTSFLVSEMSPDSRRYGKYDEAYLSDGIIHLKMEAISDTKVQRRIRCVKLRATKHDTDWYALLFKDGVFQVTEAICEVVE